MVSIPIPHSLKALLRSCHFDLVRQNWIIILFYKEQLWTRFSSLASFNAIIDACSTKMDGLSYFSSITFYVTDIQGLNQFNILRWRFISSPSQKLFASSRFVILVFSSTPGNKKRERCDDKTFPWEDETCWTKKKLLFFYILYYTSLHYFVWVPFGPLTTFNDAII